MSISSANGAEQLFVRWTISKISSHVSPTCGSVVPDREDRRPRDAAAGVRPDAPFLDHTPFWIAQQREGQQQLFNQGAVVLDWIDRYPGQADAFLDEAVPAPCVRGQLPVAVRSPVSAVENQDQRSALEVLAESPGVAVVVR